METCDHDFIPVPTGLPITHPIDNKCIRCGKSRDEILRNGFMMRAINDLLREPQHVAFIGHELESK